MPDEKDTAEPSVASAGYGCAGRLILWVALVAILAGCSTKPQSPQGYVTVCSGCGSEWESFDDKPSDPITKCPNCPMSEEEWEALKEQMRKRTKK